jgi:hypothetical protein
MLGMDGGFYRAAVRSIRIPPRLFQLQLAEANAVVVSKTLLTSLPAGGDFYKPESAKRFSDIIF